MSQNLQAYRHVAVSDEFKEKERMWAKVRHDEAQAISNAEKRGEKRGARKRDNHWQDVVANKDQRWQDVVANKDAENAKLQAQLGELRAQLKKQ